MNDQYTKKPALGFVDAIKSCFSQYARFSGRARRSEYWYWILFTYLLCAATAMPSMLSSDPDTAGTFPVVYTLCSLILLIPSWAVLVRRLHDISKSGWNILWSLIPFIGAIYIIYLTVQDSHVGENSYGESPKYVRE